MTNQSKRLLIIGGLGMLLGLLLAAGSMPRSASAATPTPLNITPTPTATPIFALPTSVYTDSMTITNTLGASIWDYSTYAGIVSMAQGWVDMANRFRVLNLISVMLAAAMGFGFLVKLLRAKGQTND